MFNDNPKGGAVLVGSNKTFAVLLGLLDNVQPVQDTRCQLIKKKKRSADVLRNNSKRAEYDKHL